MTAMMPLTMKTARRVAIPPLSEPSRAPAATPPPRRQGPQVRIRRDEPGAMQSAPARDGRWLLEFEPTAAQTVEPLMGWTAGRDPRQQVRLTFPDLVSAARFAGRNGFRADVQSPVRKTPRRRPRYIDSLRPSPEAAAECAFG